MYRKKSAISLMAIAVFALLFPACKKDKGTVSNPVQGTLSLEVHAMHHSWDVAGITIYLERNATEFPGRDSSIYDYKGIADGYGKHTFEKLFPGQYYVYASGFDSIWGSNVIGYKGVSLSVEGTSDNHLYVPLIVSE